MWKRLQRVGKEACKFQFTVSIQDLIIDCQENWYPLCVYVVWSRRGRKECTDTHPLVADPDVKNRFLVSLTVPDNLVATITMFRSGRSSKFEAKEWDFAVFEVWICAGYGKTN
ncbi:hypothetical protein HELRODRAFT_82686 [Helobdella robusta]|uniref:C2 NT-type domain-containing protein n=1 Tax=Helobdella robusta TaxID=6412 RepID=T1G4V4_HELRO|nr:hypothetical protein HELRODRAFT_82686 [Helobdella robusta]ESO00784.1 hypothetical protein HELRODRAFT_82686 [Helobdella robusta]